MFLCFDPVIVLLWYWEPARVGSAELRAAYKLNERINRHENRALSMCPVEKTKERVSLKLLFTLTELQEERKYERGTNLIVVLLSL